MIAAICLLVGVYVLPGDCEAVQVYAPYIQRLPASHWSQVAQVGLRTGGGQADQPSRTILLPPRPSLSVLAHEVAHIVFGLQDWPLQAQWDRELWDGDTPLGQLDNYPARLLREGRTDEAKREDSAKSYELYVLGRDIGRRREAWIRANLPELRRAR